MTRKYRIVEIIWSKTYKNNHKFIIQKRLFDFLWWYNPYFDDWNSGEFNSLKEAQDQLNILIDRDTVKTQRKVIYEKTV